MLEIVYISMLIRSLNYDSILLNFAIIFLSNYHLLNYKCVSFLYRCWVMVCTYTKKNTEKENQKKKKIICLDFICMIDLNIFNLLKLSIISILRIPDDGYFEKHVLHTKFDMYIYKLNCCILRSIERSWIFSMLKE